MSPLWALPVLVVALAALCVAVVARRVGSELGSLGDAVDDLERTRADVAEAIAHLDGVRRHDASGRTAPEGRR